MNVETIRELLKRAPFEIRMTNGDMYQVRHPENAMLAGSRLVVYRPETGGIAVLSLPHAAVMEFLQAA